MDLGKLSNGEKIAGVSAILLFFFMSFDWFGSKDSGELRLFSVGRSPWEALDYIPIALVLAIVATLGVVALRSTDIAYEPPVAANAVVAILGAVSVLLILFRIVDPPSFGSLRDTFGTVPIEGTVQFPIFLALASAVGIAFGGYLAMREEGISSN
jgi:hypothetical protein